MDAELEKLMKEFYSQPLQWYNAPKQETVYYQENFNTSQFKWIAYGAWGYGANHDEAHADAKRKVYKKCKEENPHLNFDEVIQYESHKNIQVTAPPQKATINGIPITTSISENAIDYSKEKINKGTIEEQIQACTTLEELKSWRILALSTEKILPIYEAKYDELKIK